MANDPYLERILSVCKRQRKKGMETYGRGIENNPALLEKRIDMALEELVDLAYYLCWIREKLNDVEND